MTHTCIIILIISLSGLLGGLTNFFLSYNIDYSKKECWINFFKTLLLSLCASITVPLFLQIISNNLLDSNTTTPYPLKNYFILAGFCILAAFYSKRFLEDLYDRVKKVEDKAEKAEKKVEILETNSQETENVNEFLFNKEIQSAKIQGSLYTNEQLIEVLQAIYNSKFIWRTVAGIKKDLKSTFNETQVNEILNILKKEDIVASRVNKSGVEVWRIAQ